MQRVRTIGSAALEITRKEVLAISYVPRVAVRAFAAAVERQYDVIARYHMRNICADAVDDARTFVTEHDRRRRREVKMHGRDVGMAQPGGDDSDQDLVRLRSGERQVLLQKRAPGLADDGCSNFHECSLGSHDSNQEMFRGLLQQAAVHDQSRAGNPSGLFPRAAKTQARDIRPTTRS